MPSESFLACKHTHISLNLVPYVILDKKKIDMYVKRFGRKQVGTGCVCVCVCASANKLLCHIKFNLAGHGLTDFEAGTIWKTWEPHIIINIRESKDPSLK